MPSPSVAGPEVPNSPAPIYILRPGTPADRAFIAKTWAETFRANPAEKRIEEGIFRRGVYRCIEAILERAIVRCAVPPSDDGVLYGYAVLEPGCIHMVYVRRVWRKMGLARRLLAGIELADSDWSTQSADFRDWIRHKYRLRHYRPFWLTENAHG